MHGVCVLSGGQTDVRLPNGDYLWPTYFLEYVDAGWVDSDLNYSEEYYLTHPNQKKR
jgi:hypothetical protein